MPGSWCLPLVAFIVWTHVAIAASSTPPPSASLAANTSTSDWWTEDHPYYYKFRYKRLANGSIVLNGNYESTVADIRRNISARQPAVVKWLMKKETRKTLKDANRFLLYNFVPSAVFGDVMTKLRAKALQKEMRNTFLLRNVAIPGLKMIGEFAWKVLKNHYGSFIEREKLYKRLQVMTVEEISEEFHVSIPEYDHEAELEGQRPNHTLPYSWKGRMQIFNGFGERFVPYTDYALQYYSPDDDLPPPVLPAASYPWLWSERLAMIRELMLQIMAINARHVDDEFSKMLALADKDDSSGSSQSAASSGSSGIEDEDKMKRLQAFFRMLQPGSNDNGSASFSSSGDTTIAVADDDDDVDDDDEDEIEAEALDQLERIVSEFHFSTGIPRLVMANNSYSPFPSLAPFLNESVSPDVDSNSGSGNGSSHRIEDKTPGSKDLTALNATLADRDDAGTMTSHAIESSSNTNTTGNASATIANASLAGAQNDLINEQTRNEERAWRTGVYDALLHFYAYPSVDPMMVFYPRKEVSKYQNETQDLNCSIARPCLVQSGVTVYTPSLTSLNFFQSITQSPVMSAEQQRRARLDALKDMVTVAFEGELKALCHGLQTPSSVWYSTFDRSIDELADAIVGFVNATFQGGNDVTSLHVYSALVQDTTKESVLFLSSSYFSTTNLDTNLSMKTRKKVPMLEAFTEAEQIELITLLADKMRQVEQAIETFVDERAMQQEYQLLVNATTSEVLYQGSQYSTLEFGFLAPATNKQNVLYRDVRRPVPSHLVLRLFVRFQESRLLLPEESYHMLACLAMLRNEISYYRCRPTNE
ncbi:hypothetical protein FI667_g7463, partial [Globisporangium splendens]